MKSKWKLIVKVVCGAALLGAGVASYDSAEAAVFCQGPIRNKGLGVFSACSYSGVNQADATYSSTTIGANLYPGAIYSTHALAESYDGFGTANPTCWVQDNSANNQRQYLTHNSCSGQWTLFRVIAF